MSTGGNILAKGLALLASVRGEGDWEWRASAAAAWASLDVADFNERDHRLDAGFFDDEAIESSTRSAVLKTSESSTALVIGYDVHRLADGTIWRVVAGPSGSMQKIYTVEIVEDSRYAPNRGRLQ